ncbi:PIG-L deacetylase family protein [Wenxinia saemankumensis]|uniref:N-acetylglucosaminyl deacetylase, LmbE family n=1 Tax=Wenxinia saemankumensis TaxID=1447782 RepID=A0A1M6HU71_9RHOB|nr:PIG-L deacetylase family protein [Wenxinia saemankumensis]SHJ25723.1 N-acetylglucosaminyl deacetylase, LmbE family [Wenxinia saemankumensis]
MTPFREDTALLRAAATAPEPELEELTGEGDVLVLAPHPDDESLACGGAIAAAMETGRRVRVVIVTDGSRSHPSSTSDPPGILAELRHGEVDRAVAILSEGRLVPDWLGYPDDAAPDGPAAFEEIEGRLAPLRGITSIWTTWGGDPHPDHQRVWRLARWLAPRIGARVWGCPVWGRFETSWDIPDRVVRFGTTPWRERKRAAVAAHLSQMTALIDDDGGGFVMPEEVQRHFVDTDEIFIPA